MHFANLGTVIAAAGVTATATQSQQTPVWWMGLVFAVVGAVYTYIINNQKK